MFLSGCKGAEPSEAPSLGSLGPAPCRHGNGLPYLLHLLLAHAKLVVAKQKRPDILADLVLHASIVNLPQQLQLLIVLRDPGGKDYVASTVMLALMSDPIPWRAGAGDSVSITAETQAHLALG